MTHPKPRTEIPLALFSLLNQETNAAAREWQNVILVEFLKAAERSYRFAVAYNIDFDDLLKKAVELINREVSFISSPTESECDDLDKQWAELIDSIIRRMEDADMTLDYSIDRMQLTGFTALNSTFRPLHL